MLWSEGKLEFSRGREGGTAQPSCNLEKNRRDRFRPIEPNAG